MSTTTRSNLKRVRRAACDRCHELKSRCTKSDGSYSDCDRCRRLGQHCVFSAPSKMGRPKGGGTRKQAQAPSDEGEYDESQPGCDEHGEGHDAFLADEQPTAYPLNSVCWGQDYPAMTFTDGDLDFLTAGFAAPNDGSPSSLELPEFDHEAMETMFMATEPDTERSFPLDSPDSLKMIINECKNNHTIPLQLSQLQLKLQQLAASSVSAQTKESQPLYSSGEGNSTLSEVLTGTETLMLIIEALDRDQEQPGTEDGQEGPKDPHPSLDDGIDWSSFSASLRETNHITILLQVVICYMQLLQIYHHLLTLINGDLQRSGAPAPLLTNDDSTQGSPATFLSNTVFTFGQFSLTSHVDIKAHVTIHLVSSMLRRIQQSLHVAMVNESLGSRKEPQRTNRNALASAWKNQELPDIGVSQASSSMLLAARAAVHHLYLEEKQVFDKLEEVKSRC